MALGLKGDRIRQWWQFKVEMALHLMVAMKQKDREEGSRNKMYTSEANPRDILPPIRPHLLTGIRL